MSMFAINDVVANFVSTKLVESIPKQRKLLVLTRASSLLIFVYGLDYVDSVTLSDAVDGKKLIQIRFEDRRVITGVPLTFDVCPDLRKLKYLSLTWSAYHLGPGCHRSSSVLPFCFLRSAHLCAHSVLRW